MYPSMDELHQAIAGVHRLDGNTPTVTNEQRLRETSIDQFVLSAVFATDPEVKTQAHSTIRHIRINDQMNLPSRSWRQRSKKAIEVRCEC